MAGFEQGTAGVGSDRSTNHCTFFVYFFLCVFKKAINGHLFLIKVCCWYQQKYFILSFSYLQIYTLYVHSSVVFMAQKNYMPIGSSSPVVTGGDL